MILNPKFGDKGKKSIFIFHYEEYIDYTNSLCYRI